MIHAIEREDLEHMRHLRGGAIFARMHGGLEPCGTRHCVEVGVVVVREIVAFRPCDIDADDAAPRVLDRLLHDDLVEFFRETTIEEEDEPGTHLREFGERALHAAERAEDDVVEIAFALAIAEHRIERRLEKRDAARAIGTRYHLVDCTLHRDGGGLDELCPVEELVVVVPRRLGFVERDEIIEFLVRFRGELDALLVSDGPQDVRLDGLAEVEVQLGERVGEFLCRFHVPLLQK